MSFFLERLTSLAADAVARTGPLAPGILFLATFIEYVFPPFPGDLLVVLGAWYSVQGALSWPATFIAVTLGGITGALVDYKLGTLVGRRVDARFSRLGGLSAERLARFEASYRRFGPWLLVLNRFVPGIRAFIFVAAGACRIPLRTVVVFGGVSTALWNVLLLAAGALLARSAEDLVRLVNEYTQVAGLVLAAAALAAAAVLLWRRRAGRRPAPGPASPEER